jgi:membrane-bound lytic murein transglycosylase B
VSVRSLGTIDGFRAAGAVIAVERCEYVTADLLLRLSVRVPFEHACPLLLVEREAVEHAYSPLLACTGRVPLSDSGEWMWRGAFPVPPDLACNPRALFTLRLREDVLLALPLPSERLFPGELVFGPQEPSQRAGSARTWPYAVRRSALLFVVTCQLCVAPGWSSAGALADGSPAGTSAGPAPETPPTPPVGGPAQPAPETPSQPAGGGSGEPTGATQPEEGGAGQSSTTTSTTPAPSSTSTAPQAATPTPTGTPAPAGTAAPTVVLQRRQKTTAATKRKASPNITATHAQPATGAAKASKGGAASGNNNVALPPQVVAAEAEALAAELASSAGSAQALGFYRIPLFLLPIYRAAAIQYGVPWQILAAINEVETNYGSDLSVSSAGAEGWMQFEPSTWLQYGVDALNAGYADPYNPVDAIFAAARYLDAAGASSDLRTAILAYNHSEAYASSVFLRAKLISSYPKSVIATLTGLVDARLPVTGKQVAWELLAPAASPSSATARAKLLPSKTAANGSAPATPGSSAPPSPTAAAAIAASVTAQAPQLVDLMSAPNAAVVAVQDGRILKLGSSRALGKYVVLRDIYGDVFTYAGLDSIAPSDAPPKAAAGSADRTGRRSHRTGHLLPLRVGSVVAQETVLGHVRVPPGAKDGHLRFAIRPAGDPNAIDPRPILANWRQLNAALHPQGATGESNLLGARASLKASVAKVAHSAGAAGRTAPSPLVLSDELTATQWNQLIARIAVLPAPKVAVKPSSAAIPDP